MKITYFRSSIQGPEKRIEDIVTSSISNTFNLHPHLTWIAASAPLGAGRPDLVVVTYKPEIFLLQNSAIHTTEILAYLFSVQKARLTTIKQRINRPDHVVISELKDLVKAKIVIESSSGYSLSPNWRSVLPDITAIEIKVADWRKAVQQAARNRVLSHRSYIALPEKVARVAATDSNVSSLGLGIMGIDNHDQVSIIKQARKSKPKVPSYYFKLAALLAAQ